MTLEASGIDGRVRDPRAGHEQGSCQTSHVARRMGLSREHSPLRAHTRCERSLPQPHAGILSAPAGLSETREMIPETVPERPQPLERR